MLANDESVIRFLGDAGCSILPLVCFYKNLKYSLIITSLLKLGAFPACMFCSPVADHNAPPFVLSYLCSLIYVQIPMGIYFNMI